MNSFFARSRSCDTPAMDRKIGISPASRSVNIGIIN
jgi:hypothetical protein